VDKAPGFNPGLGFLPTSAPSATITGADDIRFNPGLGFLPTSACERVLSVSPLRSFNPGLGFLPTSADISGETTNQQGLFQSRSGFSPYFGINTDTTGITSDLSFNPGLVFSLLRLYHGRGEPQRTLVSIPVWVFSLLRHGLDRGLARRTAVSIPVWVFSLLRPNVVTVPDSVSLRFQSRSGFSPYFGVGKSLDGSETTAKSFNPGLGFLPTSARPSQRRWWRVNKFQSRSGFSPYFGEMEERLEGLSSIGFNPGLGFLPTSAPSPPIPAAR